MENHKENITMEKIRKKASEIAYGCFYAGVIIEVLLVLIDKSAYINPIEGQIFRLTFLLFLTKVCLTRYSAKEYATIVLFGIVGAVSYYVTGRNEILRAVIFIAACKNIDIKKCLKLVFYLTLTGCMVIMLLAVTGIYGTISLTQDYGRGCVETRYTMGMGHPNALQCMVWALTILGLYLYGEKMKWYHYGLILMINVFFFLLTGSKTSFVVTLFSMGMVLIVSRSGLLQAKKWISRLGILVCGGSVGISVFAAANAYRLYDHVWNYDNSRITMIFWQLDRILTGRIYTLIDNERFEGAIRNWGMFSSPENSYYFDMGWVRLFYWYGIIPGCIFLLVMACLLVYDYRRNDYMGIALITALFVYTIAEAHIISVYLARNYLLFLVGGAWCGMLQKNWKDKGNKEKRRSVQDA